MAEQQRFGQGRFITRQDIEERPAATVTDLITRQPGLGAVQVDMSTIIVMTARGLQQCIPDLYIDGVKVVYDVANHVDLSAQFTPEMIEGIEIYSSPGLAPAEFRNNTNPCGAIAIWSRYGGGGNPFTLKRVAFALGWLTTFLVLRAL
jgi:hypothetical protein